MKRGQMKNKTYPELGILLVNVPDHQEVLLDLLELLLLVSGRVESGSILALDSVHLNITMN